MGELPNLWLTGLAVESNGLIYYSRICRELLEDNVNENCNVVVGPIIHSPEGKGASHKGKAKNDMGIPVGRQTNC